MICIQSKPFVIRLWTLLLLGVCVPLNAMTLPNQQLELIQGEQHILIPIAQLRRQAHQSFVVYDPFALQKIHIQGVDLKTFLTNYFDPLPQQLRIKAWDDYTVVLSDWQFKHWVLVTAQNDQYLTLRDRGPLRLVRVGLDLAPPVRLRDFKEWIWMIRQIQVVQE